MGLSGILNITQILIYQDLSGCEATVRFSLAVFFMYLFGGDESIKSLPGGIFFKPKPRTCEQVSFCIYQFSCVKLFDLTLKLSTPCMQSIRFTKSGVGD